VTQFSQPNLFVWADAKQHLELEGFLTATASKGQSLANLD
jgi:hypothetical protein